MIGRGPFNGRRQTAGNNNDDIVKINRRNTSNSLNRHESQSQLTDFEMQDSKEVELNVQRDENS